MDLASLHIKEVILHQIAKTGSASVQPVLSDIPTPLDEDDRAYVHDRLKRALSRHARPVVEDPGVSALPAMIRDYLLGSGSNFVENSKEFAHKLQMIQPTMSPAGILLVANASLLRKPALLIAKVEHEQGIRARETTTTEGGKTFTVEFLHDLLFTSAAKVYKVGIFPAISIRGDLLRGRVADNQTGKKLAHYFLGTYLGCKLVERPEVLTQKFYDAAQKWVNSIEDGEKKTRYQVALLSEMQKNSTSLSVARFAQEYLDVNHRDEFKVRMQEADVPLRQFDKSVDLIKGKIQKVKIETRNDIWVLAPPESLDDGTVTIENTTEGESELRVHDRVRRVSGYGSLS